MSIDHKAAKFVAKSISSSEHGMCNASEQLLARAYLDLAAQLEQERDIRSDLEIVLSLVADGLKVSHEPHQTFTERLLEASCAKGDAALRADNTPKQT